MPLRLTRQADSDISGILRDTLTTFGEKQSHTYAALLQAALQLIETDPDRASARRRDDIRSGVRSFHLALAAKRRGAAAHQIYFIKVQRSGSVEVVVIRVLHERMEPKRRVLEGLQAAGSPADPR